MPTENVRRLQKDLFAPLLSACDDAREQLAAANIQIKVCARLVWGLLILLSLSAHFSLYHEGCYEMMW